MRWSVRHSTWMLFGGCCLGFTVLAHAADKESSPAVAVATDAAEESDSVVTFRSDVAGSPQKPTALDDAEEVHQPALADTDSLYEASDRLHSATTTDAEEEKDAADFGAALREAVPAKVKRRTTDLAKEYRTPTPVEPTRFHGVQPGVSMKADLISAWGQPTETTKTKTGETLTYDIDPFAAVEVHLEKDLVKSIHVELEQQEEHRELAKKLRLDAVESVEVRDDLSNATRAVAYPERGVLLLLAPSKGDAPQFASHLVLQELQADAFALRVENHLHGPYEKNLSDLQRALLLDPQNAQAHWLLADIHLATGQVVEAEAAAAQAHEIVPDNAAYQLRWACTLENTGRYEEAVLETRAILDNESVPEIVRAQALHQMGLLASQGDSQIAEKAVGFHTMAIEVADKLATSDDLRERRAALEVLLDAHLAVAREVARRDYDDKIETVSQWISRSSGLAEEMIANENGPLELRLRVAEQALAALASMKPTKDPAPWIKEAEETAQVMLEASDDPLWQDRIHWELGTAYFHATRIEHTRQQPDRALAYGQKAIEYLADGASLRDAQPEAQEMVGLLYFHLGAVQAVYKQNHAKAVTWYEKAIPYLTDDAVTPRMTVPRRQGEALVSMAVSYWQQGEKQQALELTELGADLIERAVAGGVIDQEVLAVPYGNLATMHRLLGNTSEAAKYKELAKEAQSAEQQVTKPVMEPRVQQPTANRNRAQRSAMRTMPQKQSFRSFSR